MSKTSMIYRNLHRKEKINKYYNIRQELKDNIKKIGYQIMQDKDVDSHVLINEQTMLVNKLNNLPRNSSPIRYRNRCEITGRGRGVYRAFNICRIKIREYALLGYIPGIRASSW